MSSVTFPVAIGGDGSTVSDDDNATTGLRNGGWRTRFIPCFTNLVNIADYMVSYTAQTSTFAEPPPMGSTTPNTGAFTRVTVTGSTAPTNGMFLPTTNTLAWSTNSTERMRINSAGNVGIGLTNPGTPLDVNGVIRGISAVSLGYPGTAGSASAFGAGTISTDANWGMYFRAQTGAAITEFAWLNGAGTERARIDSSGNFILTAAGSINLNTLNTYSSSASGYQKLPSGIIIQWGTTLFNGSGVASITFPIAFPNACRFVSASVQRGTTLAGYLMSTQVGVFSTTGVTIIGNYTTSGTVFNLSANEGAAWIAIGY